ALIGAVETQRVGLARGRAALGLARVDAGAAAVIAGRLAPRHHRRTALVQLGGRAEATIERTSREQARPLLAVDAPAPGLEVWPIAPAGAGAFVPRQPQPAQRVDDRLRGLRGRAFRVRVLDAQHENAPALAREQIIVECRAGPTDMEVARGARSET